MVITIGGGGGVDCTNNVKDRVLVEPTESVTSTLYVVVDNKLVAVPYNVPVLVNVKPAGGGILGVTEYANGAIPPDETVTGLR